MAALRENDTVLVTGASGFVGSAVVAEALDAGLKVRATARNEARVKQLKDGFAGSRHSDNLEVVIVPDMDAPGAYNEAIKGVQGVAHVASPVTFSDKWDEVVAPALAAYQGLLEAAAAEPAVRRFVLTSSTIAAAPPSFDKPVHVKADTWNDGVVEAAKASPDPVTVYAASKVLTEKLAWDFVREKKPHFALTSVLSAMTFGHAQPASTSTSTNGWLKGLFEGNTDAMNGMKALYFINLNDVARLHVAGLVREDVKDERIFGYVSPINWATLIKAALKADPSRKIDLDLSQPDFNVLDQTQVDNSRVFEILGKDNVADVETTVKELLGKAPVHAAHYVH